MRPYRKASEYVVHAHSRPSSNSEPKSAMEIENENLRQKIHIVTRKLEHTEAEYAQNREYLENQLLLSNNKLQSMAENYKKLQANYNGLSATNHELDEKLQQVEQIASERLSLIKEVELLNKKVTEARGALIKAQSENERLRKDCNLAVSLLKCNKESYEVKKPEELPRELRQRVDEYKVDLQDYNEYINPYNHSDSDDNMPTHEANENGTWRRNTEPEAVPADMLARVLRKQEVGRLDMQEESDYPPRDYSQNSMYHGSHYLEKKLIKPDYSSEEFQNHSSNAKNHMGQHEPSPWEMNTPQPVKESSPWEMAPQRHSNGTRYEADDDSPAGAYGAYSVRPKRRQVSREYIYNEGPPQPRQASNQAISKHHSGDATQSSSPGIVRKPTPYKTNNAFKSSPSMSSVSSSSSRKSTPNRARPRDAVARHETSSLLNSKDSDEEDEEKVSPGELKKIYKLNKSEDISELTSSLTHDDTDSNCGDGQIDLEWDPTLMTDSSVQSEPLPVPVKEDQPVKKKAAKKKSPSDKLAKVLASLDDVTDEKPKKAAEAAPNLLLSYNELNHDSPPKSNIDILQDLFDANQIGDKERKEEVDRLQELLPSPKHQPTSSEVVNNPLLESFFESPPPPPQEFASREKVLIPTPVHSSNDSTPSHQSAAVSGTTASISVSDDSAMLYSHVDQASHVETEMECDSEHLEDQQQSPISGTQESEQVVVVDTDELTDLKPTTSNSYDHSQESGDVMSD